MRATTNCTFRLSFSFDSRFSLPPPLFLPFVGSERTGKCWSGPPLLFLFHHGLPPFILLRDNTSRSNNENYSQRVGAIPVRTISRYSCQLVPTFVLVPPPFHPIAVPRVRQNPVPRSNSNSTSRDRTSLLFPCK